jgi:hypothetical protein
LKAEINIKGGRGICMFMIGTTQKLQKELNLNLLSFEDNLSDSYEIWHMNLFKIGRYKCIAAIHDETLYNMVIIGAKKRDFSQIDSVVRENLRINMTAQGFAENKVKRFLSFSEEMKYTKTHNRSTLGCLKEVIDTVQYLYPTEKEIMNANVAEINLNNNHIPFLKFKHFPIKMMNEYLDHLLADSI